MKKTLFSIMTMSLWLWLMAMTTASCQRGGDDVVARAYGSYLYRTDIEGLVPEGTAPDDSVAIIANYINQWLQQQVVLEQARKTVKKDFEKELQNYKNSLIAYEYEQMVVAEALDTNVDEHDLQAYYEANTDMFLLRFPIERSISVRLPGDAPCLQRMRNLMAKPHLSDADLDAIQQMAATYALDYDFDQDTWKPQYQQSDDEESVTLRHAFESKAAGTVAPFEFERDAIRTIILNRRKIDIIKNMQRDLIKDADSKGQIEIR